MQGSTLKLPLRRSLLLGRRLSRRHANRRAGGDPHPLKLRDSSGLRTVAPDHARWQGIDTRSRGFARLPLLHAVGQWPGWITGRMRREGDPLNGKLHYRS